MNQGSPLQDEAILHPWMDTHDLKKIKKEWWKGIQKVVMQGMEESARSFKHITISLTTDTQASAGHFIWYQGIIGGQS